VLAARAGLDLAKTRVVYEGSDSFLMPAPHGAGPREDRLLAVSALAPHKGLFPTLELFAALLKRRPGLELDIVGGDWRGFGTLLGERVRSLGLSGSVRLLDGLDAAALAERYERSLALLMLSECEAFGLPLVEAMRYGLPVVSSGLSSLREVAAGAALELDRDARTAVEDVLAVLDAGAARDELVTRGRQRAAALTWQAAGEGMARVVREVAVSS
jgi:glycosyltransferase involved in cell wall biosynthesis